MLETQMVKNIEIRFAYKSQIISTFGILSNIWQLARNLFSILEPWTSIGQLYQPIGFSDTKSFS